jgi:choice-of-anchor B domain-containing protein
MRLRLALVSLAVLSTNVVFLGPSLANPTMQEQKMEQWGSVAAEASSQNVLSDGLTPCVDGMAGEYPCEGIDMMSRLSLAELGLSFANDVWGWTDPQTGRDYALMGGIEGTVIVDISSPSNPDFVGILPTHSAAGNAFWRDIKVYNDHMFVGSEHSGHGLQVFDLTEVRGVTGPPVTFSETAHYTGFSNSHNININEDTGYLYAIGSNTCAGGLHMVNISNPASPAFAGCFADEGYIHDTQCVVYEGPDAEHRGKEICFNSNAEPHHEDPTGIINAVSVVDVSDKANPIELARIEYPDDGYSHQGWLTAQQRYFLHGDELDEVDNGHGTVTRVWDVRDLDNPTLVNVFENTTTSIDHNLYTEGNASYHSNYTSGLRVYDLRNLPSLSEKLFFDVYPENDNASFEGGTWSNYPYFSQNRIVAVSSMDRGLFVLRVRG